MHHIKKINEVKINLNYSALLNLNATERKFYVRAELAKKLFISNLWDKQNLLQINVTNSEVM